MTQFLDKGYLNIKINDKKNEIVSKNTSAAVAILNTIKVLTHLNLIDTNAAARIKSYVNNIDYKHSQYTLDTVNNMKEISVSRDNDPDYIKKCRIAQKLLHIAVKNHNK